VRRVHHSLFRRGSLSPRQVLAALAWSLCTISVAFGSQAIAAPADPQGIDADLSTVTVVDSQNHPLAGTQLEVEVLPIGGAAAWGDRPWASGGEAHTGPNGELFVTLVPPGRGASSLRSDNDIVNYEVMLPATGDLLFATSRYYGSDPTVQQEFAEQASAQRGVTIKLNNTQTQVYRRSLTKRMRPNIGICTQSWRYWNQASGNTVVGEFHTLSAWGSKATWTYGATADTTVDVGLSSDGTNWSVNGSTAHVSNTQSATTIMKGGQSYGKKMTLWFTYEEDRLDDTCQGWLNSYQVYPTQWQGGSLADGQDQSFNDGKTLQTYGRALNPNTDFTRSNSSAQKYNASVNVFGATLGATSGFSSYVQSYWRNTTTTIGCLDGSNNWPTSAGIIYAGYWTTYPSGAGSC
jgi:hypothetical protein